MATSGNGRGAALALAALIALGGAASGGPALAQVPAAASAPLPFALKPLGPGVYAAIDAPQGRSGSNAGFVIGDDGVAVIDSFFSPDAARALLAEIHRLTPLPVKYVINTHYHVDHTGGDAVFREAGAVIIAHRNVRGWVRTENIHLFGDRITPALKAQVEGLALPDLVTDKDLTIWLGSRRVEVRAERGHTGGDLVVSIPDARVLFCGDLLWRRFAPNIIDGTVPLWIATDKAFAHLPDAAAIRFVPGHGDVANVQDVADFAGYLTELTALVREEIRHGLKDKALADAVMPRLKARFPDWTAIDRGGPREIGYMEAELKGTKRVPVPVKD
jgi:cyclase